MAAASFQVLRPKSPEPSQASLFLPHSTTILQKDPLVLSKHMQTLHPDPSHHCLSPTAISNSFLVNLTAPTTAPVICPQCRTQVTSLLCSKTFQWLPFWLRVKAKDLTNCLHKIQHDLPLLPLGFVDLPFPLCSCVLVLLVSLLFPEQHARPPSDSGLCTHWPPFLEYLSSRAPTAGFLTSSTSLLSGTLSENPSLPFLLKRATLSAWQF